MKKKGEVESCTYVRNAEMNLHLSVSQDSVRIAVVKS